MTSPDSHPPPPPLFLSRPELLPRIQEQVRTPPDPRILPWSPPPRYDPQAVAIRRRLDRSARAAGTSPEPAHAKPPPAPARVRSAFPSGPEAPPAAGGPPERPRFSLGAIQGPGRAARGQEEEPRRRPRGGQDDMLDRLKKTWLPPKP